MKSSLTVSVVIPTFNREHTIEKALDSVLQQTQAVLEIIVVDDGSNDGTADLIQKKYPKVQYIVQTQQGVSAARNRGIRASAGQWIALLDSDDAWLPQKIEKQIEAISEQPERPLCHTNEIWVRNGRRVNAMKKHEKKGGWIFQDCLPLCAISPSSVLIQKTLFDVVGYFDETLPACEDYELWLRICARYPVSYVAIPLTIKTGGHADQLSRQHWGMDRFRIKALDKILSSQVLKADDEIAAREMLHQKCDILLKGAIRRGNDELSADCLGLKQRHPLEQGV